LAYWPSELARIFWLSLLGVFVGLVVGHVTLVLLLVTAGYLAWYVINLVRLERWLRKGRTYRPPDSWGLWGEVFQGIQRLQKSSRKRKKRLVNLLNRFRESTNAMPDGAVVLTPEGEIEWWNDAAEDMFGLRYPKDVGLRITNLVRYPDFIDYIAKGDYTGSVEIPAPNDEERSLALYVVAYGNNQQLLMARDVTLMHRLEQMRADFVANVSHELRTPLTVINGFLETLADGDEDSVGQWRRSLQIMQQQALRMQNIVEDLLLLSRLEYGRDKLPDEPVAVPEFLSSLREEAELLSGDKAHVFEMDTDPELYLRGHTKELESAFTNLVSNAVRYTPAKGRIRIRWYEDAAGAHFEVRDTGVGIPREHLPRLTERFYRVDVARSREQGGTGLGLAIVKHVLKRHQAELHVDSEVGEGSTFRCDFPAEAVLHRSNIYRRFPSDAVAR